jgi:hypothetical protein
MAIKIDLSSADVGEDRIATVTRELLKDVRTDVDPHAKLVTEPAGPGTKGDVALVGQIILALVTGGAVTKLIESIFSFLSSNRKLDINIENAAGETLNVNMEFVNRNGMNKAMAVAEEFLNRGA